jgi:dipeptidyl aminopeptidase/acylaminoacyl peptidase
MARGMVPEDLFRIQWVSDAQLSRQGTIAFVVTKMDKDADDYRSQVWTVGNAAGAGRPFTSGAGKDKEPRWSPDGTQLAFTSDRESGAQLYLMSATGGEARKLTAIPQGVGNPVWSPDGSRIVVTVRTGGNEGEDKKPKTVPARVITELKHKYNGDGFTFDRRRHLFVVDVATGETKQVTDGEFHDTQPAWSPDGRRIAFVSSRHEGWDLDRVQDIYVIDSDGGTPTRVTDGISDADVPAWSPSGNEIAWLGSANAEDPPRSNRLHITNVADGSTRCLTPASDFQLSGTPAWSLDGRSILVGADTRGRSQVIRVDVAAGSIVEIPGNGNIQSWSANDAGSIIACTATDPVHPAEVFRHDEAGDEKLTELNKDWLAEVTLVVPEPFVVKSDGWEIDAWVMLPPGAEARNPCPVLLNIHGGPFVQYGWQFFDEFQVQCGAGYAVVFGNPRGSSGRGDDFARALISDPARPMAADCYATVDEALRLHPELDAERVGLVGGSYGGYLIGWIVGETDRFKAACSERGIYNRFSRETTGDIPTAYTYLRKHTWEDPALYWEHSPIRRVEAMHTPLLLVHGEEDMRCPIEQSEQLFTALKQLRRDVTFMRLPGENHEYSRSGKPSHRIERFDLQIGFFGDKLRPDIAD